MRNFQYHLFNPYAVNEGVVDKIVGFFGKEPKKPPSEQPPSSTTSSTLRQRRQDELNSEEEGYISPFGLDGPVSPKIIEEQKKRAERERKTLKLVAGPNAIIPQSNNSIPPRTTTSQPSNIQPPKINNPTNNITSIPISFTPQTFRLPAAASKFKYTSDKLKGIIDQLQKDKGVKNEEMNQYTPYLFHSPLLEYNDEYLNEGFRDWLEKIKGSFSGLVRKANQMDRTQQNINQGVGEKTLYTPELKIMQQTGIGSKEAADRVLRTQARSRIDTDFGRKIQERLDIARRAGVSPRQAAAMQRTMNGIEERKNQNPPNNPRSKVYSKYIGESTDISQYSPYLFHSPLLEDFYFTENCIDDPIEYPPYVGF